MSARDELDEQMGAKRTLKNARQKLTGAAWRGSIMPKRYPHGDKPRVRKAKKR